MFLRKRILSVGTVAVIAALCGLPCALQAGSVALSSYTPIINGEDVANLTTANPNAEKVWSDATNPGQSFTTGAGGETLKAFSFQLHGDSEAGRTPAGMNYTIRVVAMDGSGNTTTVAIESNIVYGAGAWAAEDWLTWTFETPVTLLPTTLYGIDLEHVNGGGWQDGITYLRRDDAAGYADGNFYKRDDGNPTTTDSPNGEMIFHIDIESSGPPPPSAGGVVGVEGIQLKVTGQVGDVQWQTKKGAAAYSNVVGAVATTLDITDLYTTTPSFRVQATDGTNAPAYSNEKQISGSSNRITVR
jgi:hypothetical protein